MSVMTVRRLPYRSSRLVGRWSFWDARGGQTTRATAIGTAFGYGANAVLQCVKRVWVAPAVNISPCEMAGSLLTQLRHCEERSDEAIHTSCAAPWIASRSLSSGRASRGLGGSQSRRLGRPHLGPLRRRHREPLIALGRNLVADLPVGSDAADIGHEDPRLAGNVGTH